jgi:hypothetical protein
MNVSGAKGDKAAASWITEGINNLESFAGIEGKFQGNDFNNKTTKGPTQ